MSTITLQVSITDAIGAVGVATATAQIDTVTIVSSTVTPQNAPAGTQRTWTVVAQSSSGAALTAGTPTANRPGPVFTPVSGQPPGTFAWTFTA